MADDSQSVVSSGENLLDEIDAVLTDLTSTLLPDYAVTVRETEPNRLGALMSHWVNLHLTEDLQGKTLTEALGQIAVLAVTQLKVLDKEVKQGQEQLRKALGTCRQLEQELETAKAQAANLAHEAVEARELMSRAHTEIGKLKAEQKGVSEELMAAKDELVLLRQQEVKPEDELEEIRTRLEKAHTSPARYDEDVTDIKRDLRRALDGGLDQPTRTTRGITPTGAALTSFPVLLDQEAAYPLPGSRLLAETFEPSSSRPRYKPTSPSHSPGPSYKDLDKIARNITRFDPKPDGASDVARYLRDIEFFLKRFPRATVEDKIYLIKITASREVSSFIERQPHYVQSHYEVLCQALEEDYSNHLSQTGLTAAFLVKQQRQESPLQYYVRLRQTYFGTRNEPGMEEEMHFKALFVQNLHPATSQHLGVAACPRSLSSKQLRDLALRGFSKLQQAGNKRVESPSVLSLDSQAPPLELEGAPSFEPQDPIPTPQGPKGSQEGPQTQQPYRGRNHSNQQWSGRKKSRTEGETNQRNPNRRQDRLSPKQRPHQRPREKVMGDRDPHAGRESIHKSSYSHPQDDGRKRTRPPHKGDSKEDRPNDTALSQRDLEMIKRVIRDLRRETKPKADLFAVTSLDPDSMPQIPATHEVQGHPQVDPNEIRAMPIQHPSPAAQRDTPDPSIQGGESLPPPSAVLVVQLEPKEGLTLGDHPMMQGEPPFQQFLGHLSEKGVARKFYLSTTLEHEFLHEAILDTASDITLMSSTLFHQVRAVARRHNRELQLQSCPLKIQPYSPASLTLSSMALVHLAIGPMSLIHPVHVSTLETIPFLIGKDLLNRFEPLIDFKRLRIWAQVREPLPISPPQNPEVQCCRLETKPGTLEQPLHPQPVITEDPVSGKTTEDSSMSVWPPSALAEQRDTFLCSFTPTTKEEEFCPSINNGVILEGSLINDVILALWADKSAISRELFEELGQANDNLQFVTSSCRFPLDSTPVTTMTADGICVLTLRWNKRVLTHFFLVVPGLPHKVYVGSDVLVRLDVHVDTINQVLWSLTDAPSTCSHWDPDNMKSGQTIPEVGQVFNDHHIVVPANADNVALSLTLRPGQHLDHRHALFQPSPRFFELGLSLEATPLVELRARSTWVLVQNTSTQDITIPRSSPLGWLVSTKFHDFELRIPVIGHIPHPLFPEPAETKVVYTKPTKAIVLFPALEIGHDAVCRIDLADYTHMTLQTATVLTVDLPSETEASTPNLRQSTNGSPEPQEQPFPGFAAQVDQVIAQADALTTDEEREKLRQVLNKYKASFAKDSTDCGLTTIHSVRIPTRPGAPPTFVRQYKIPLASYEPVQEIIDDLLEKGIIRPCNSTYSAPLWPVLKPNGKWRLTIDYRKLNQQVPLSRWPMTQLEQDLPKVRNAKYFSTIDVASGFWTIPVHVADQHKLAFTFARRQYTFTRCPFGYANSPAEFNIFLNKACPDAQERGTLIYVDDILMRNHTLEAHLREIEHVLSQLMAAGAKMSLPKCQWCRIKVNYVGLLVGADGVEPQFSRVQGVANITAPTNIAELRSFLGVCNYSRQFIEDYADIARPLYELLKANVPFTWSKTQGQAMQALKDKLCTAPCLAYPDENHTFHLEVGFLDYCLSAGLYQMHDHDKRVVAYASKTMLPPEHKYNDCEKALLSTVWAVKHFSNYLGGQKVIVETHHQPVAFLNSQRIRDGTVTNARVASWLMALQSFDVEVRYAQNRKTPLGTGLASCRRCTDDTPAYTPPTLEAPPPAQANHHYFDANTCADMITVYVDGCSFRREKTLLAGVGIVWVDDTPYEPQKFSLGPRSSQYAEVAGILITLQLAVQKQVEMLVICTDSNYACLSFTCHLKQWKANNFITSGRKPVKHKELFAACEHLVDKHNLHIYWKKVRGHSRTPGEDKFFNDQADGMAKLGAYAGTPWTFDTSQFPPPPMATTYAITRAQAASTPIASHHGPASASICPAFSDDDLVALQLRDPAICRMVCFLCDPSTTSIPPHELDSTPGLRHLFNARASLRIIKGLLVHDSAAHTSPTTQGAKATYHALQQVAYWPHMKKDVADYIRGCLVCCQFQPANPLHRAPLQKRGLAFPWSDLQLDWVGPLTRTVRGNKYFLTVTCAFTKWVEGLPAPNDTALTTAYLLMNHIFSRFGLPSQVNSDRGTHFTAEVMQQLWQLLGVKANFHISHHPQSSGQVERANRTVITILKKYVTTNQRDWDVKLPLVLMAIRATPHEATGVSPFELMTGRQMTLPLHLLYQPGEASIAVAYTTHQYVEDLQKHLRAMFAFAQKKLEKSAEGRKAYYDQKASFDELQVGDKVWYYTFAPPTGVLQYKTNKLTRKLLPRWSGPHTILDKLSPVVYQIQIGRSRGEQDDLAVRAPDCRPHNNPRPTQPIAYSWSTPDTLLAATVGLGYLLTVAITLFYVRRNRALQNRLDTWSNKILKFVRRKKHEPNSSSNPPEEDHEEPTLIVLQE
ncbi:hypothetical protein MHYP_G00045040 [Metynnis hypsauchen]